jgi:pimeloyl-ACP methyl ester carboxylesterase
MRTLAAVVVLLAAATARADYANVDGLKMYYEVHGSGPPLLLLHGGTTTIAYSFGKHMARWSRTHKVIAVEQIGHGHTADVAARAFSYEQMTEDTLALLTQLKVATVDIVGWSDGGTIALMLAMRHPERVRKLVVSGPNCRDGRTAEMETWLASSKPEEWPKDIRDAYAKVSPDGAAHWPLFLARVKKMWAGFADWDEKELAKLSAPTLVMVGDGDFIRTEHAVELSRAIPEARLWVLPGTGHNTFNERVEWVDAVVLPFLDEPMAPKK